MKKIGIYSGTFDPIHNGHLAFVRQVIAEGKVESVVFLPELSPRNKQNVSPIDKRITSIEQIIRVDDLLSVDKSDEPHFSVRTTLPMLQKTYTRSELSFLIGSDVVLHLHEWDDIELLIGQSAFLIAMRNTETVEEIHSIMDSLAKSIDQAIRYTIINTGFGEISSSQFRNHK